MQRIAAVFRDPSEPGFDLRGALASLRRERDQGVLEQAADLARLMVPPQRLSPFEYCSFGLYDDDRFPWSEKRRFIGRRSPIYRRLRDRRWAAVADDKVLLHAVLQGLGVPTPRLLALYCSAGRRAGRLAAFGDPAELAGFLRAGMEYPFFGKPVQGVYGQGAAHATGYEAASDCLQLADGRRIGVDAFVAALIEPARMGYLFQEVVAADPATGAITGGRLAVVRLDIFWGYDAPRVVYAKSAFVVGRNDVSNFKHGSLGNLYAIVDPESGCLGPVITGCRWDAVTMTEYHPDTGARLLGTQIPGWVSIRDFGLEIARLVPGLRLQSWDIVLTPRGPVALELNLGGDSLFMAQRLTGRGFLDDEILGFASGRPVS